MELRRKRVTFTKPCACAAKSAFSTFKSTMCCACHEKWLSSLLTRHPKLQLFLAFGMILTTSTLTHLLPNRCFTWALSQKRSFSSHLATANPNVTARFNTSKTPVWNCKSQWNYDANVSLSRNPAPVQRNASPFLHYIQLLCKSQWNSGANWHVTRPWKVTFWSSPQRQGHRSRIRTLADGCGRLRTRKQRPANTALPSDSQS